MTRLQLAVAWVFSAVCGAVLLWHLARPPARPDYTVVFLLALAVFPWMVGFLKRLKVPGLIDAEFRDKARGQTDRPEKPYVVPSSPTVTAGSLSGDSQKILATLWHYQRALDDTYRKRWTFTVNPISPEYPAFLRGLAELVSAGFVAIASDSGQCMLTNPGIDLMQSGRGPAAEVARYTFQK